MRFRLFDKASNKQVHEGVMPRNPAPPVIIWGARAFLLSGERTEAKTDGGHVVGNYVEVDAFQIGGFR